MYRTFLIWTALLFTIKCAAIDVNYSVATIPDSLKANAKMVVRDYSQTFEIKSPGLAVETISYVYTILNQNGYEYAQLNIPYSQKLNRVYNIRGAVYDANGDKIENLTQEKVVDQSAISGYTLFDDSRSKLFVPKNLSFPFTVEYSYVIEYDGILHLPTWLPMTDYNVSVQKSSFKMIAPQSLHFRYREKNLPANAYVVTKEKETESYLWEIKDHIAILDQPFSSSFTDFSPAVLTAPNEIEIEGYHGKLDNWTDFGKWTASLIEGRDIIPAETKALMVEKTKNCKSDYEKAKVVYEYMQEKTRYVGILIGIGGWQPIPAETVDRLGYGDCKALTNYTRSLLDAVGVKSYYTRIHAGYEIYPLDVSFPSSRFNHIILCLPLASDTVWLECTNQHVPFGFIGGFTDDRDALVITEKGGEIMHTRIYSKNDNMILRNTIIQLGGDGNAVVNRSGSYKGLYYDDRVDIYLAGTEDQREILIKDLNIPGAILKKFQLKEERSEYPEIKEELQLEVARFGTISGTRLLVPLVPTDKTTAVPKKVSIRLSDVVLYRDRTEIDTFRISIPEGYTPEAIPSEVKTDTKFGSYYLKAVVAGNEVICTRIIEIKKGKNPPSSYNELIEFFKKMAAADNSKMSLKKAI